MYRYCTLSSQEFLYFFDIKSFHIVSHGCDIKNLQNVGGLYFLYKGHIWMLCFYLNPVKYKRCTVVVQFCSFFSMAVVTSIFETTVKDFWYEWGFRYEITCEYNFSFFRCSQWFSVFYGNSDLKHFTNIQLVHILIY